MKNSILIVGGLLFAGIALIQSCSDPCKDVTCQNGGTCSDGVCTCPTGYSGTNCETEDKCITQNVTCQNGGTCNNGICTCATGYEGTTCATEMRTKFIGTYADNGSDNCATASYSVTVTSSSQAVNKILISNFGKYGCNSQWPTVEATVDGTSLTISSQTFCTGDQYTVQGTGTISGNNLTISYNGTAPPSDGGGTYNCSVTFTKL